MEECGTKLAMEAMMKNMPPFCHPSKEEDRKKTNVALLFETLNAVKTTIFYLNHRAGLSERAAHKYLKQLVSKEGPYVATAHVGAQIHMCVDGLGTDNTTVGNDGKS
eukprot:15345881-Ditylum_brightwellii.AAC.1